MRIPCQLVEKMRQLLLRIHVCTRKGLTCVTQLLHVMEHRIKNLDDVDIILFIFF